MKPGDRHGVDTSTWKTDGQMEGVDSQTRGHRHREAPGRVQGDREQATRARMLTGPGPLQGSRKQLSAGTCTPLPGPEGGDDLIWDDHTQGQGHPVSQASRRQ